MRSLWFCPQDGASNSYLTLFDREKSDDHLAALQNGLTAQTGVCLQGVRRGETVDFDIFWGRKTVVAPDDIEVTGRAGAVAATLVFQCDPMRERRVQYRIASRRRDGKAVRQKSQRDRGKFIGRRCFHGLSSIGQGSTVMRVR